MTAREKTRDCGFDGPLMQPFKLDDDDPMDDAMNVDDGITMKREADSLDDYNGQSAALYDALWPVFLRRRGLRCK